MSFISENIEADFLQDDFFKSDSVLEQELLADPENPKRFVALALRQSILKKHRLALENIKTAIHLAPSDASYYYAQGFIFAGANNTSGAVFSLNEALRLDPENLDCHLLLSQIRADEGNWNYSLSAAEKGMLIDPSHEGCTNARLQALASLDRWEDARDVAVEALEHSPRHKEFMVSLGLIELELDNLPAAEELFQEVLRADPEHARAKEGMASVRKESSLLRKSAKVITPGIEGAVTVAKPAGYILLVLVASVLTGRMPLGRLVSKTMDTLYDTDRYLTYVMDEERPNAHKIRAGFLMLGLCLLGIVMIVLGGDIGGLAGSILIILGILGIAWGITQFLKKLKAPAKSK